MPIHDWHRVEPGLFHHFHQLWSVEFCNALNQGILPSDFFALVETKTSGFTPDILALKRTSPLAPAEPGGVAVAAAPPRARHFVRETAEQTYVRKANRVAIRTALGELVAVVEIVSPGNKSHQRAFETFVGKVVGFLNRGVNVLLVDLFPPSRRDPFGIHHAIWSDIEDGPFALPPDKPLTVAAYSADPCEGYVEPVAVGDPLPSLPLFLAPGLYVPAPLEGTYAAAWAKCPAPFREAVAPE